MPKREKRDQGAKTGKSRILTVFMAFIILVVGAGLAIWALKKAGQEQEYSGAQLKSAPRIKSVPGSGESSEEFIKLQRAENLQRVKQAEKHETAAIPTITKVGHVGNVIDISASASQPSGALSTSASAVAGERLANSPECRRVPNPEDCAPGRLKLAREAGVEADELECKGCTLTQLNDAGYTIGEMVGSGVTATELKAIGYTPEQLKESGFNAKELMDAGVAGETLKNMGYTAAQLAAANVTPADMKRMGYTAAELKDAGISVQDLKKAGATPVELKDAGFTAAELKKSGFNALDLRADAGYSTPEMVAAGYSDQELTQANISVPDITQARKVVGTLGKLPPNCDQAALLKARQEGFTAAQIKTALNCSAEKIRAAGYSVPDLKTAGYTGAELNAAGFSAADLSAAGFNATELKKAGYSPFDIKQAGIPLGEMARAGFGTDELINAGASVQDLKNLPIKVETLKAGGASAAELKQAGFTSGDLIRAGYTPQEIVGTPETTPQAELKTPIVPQTAESAVSTITPISTGEAPTSLKATAGVSAKALKTAGATAQQAKQLGYTDEELVAAGYSPEEVKVAAAAQPSAPPTTPSTTKPITGGNVSTSEIAAKAADITKALATPVARPGTELPQPAAIVVEQKITQPAGAAGVSTVTTVAQETTPKRESSADLVPRLPTEEEKIQARLDTLQKRQANQMTQQQRQELARQIEANMATQAGDLISSWSPPPTQQYVPGQKEKETEKGKSTKGSSGGVVLADGTIVSEDSSGGSSENSGTIIKAGSIMFAVLDTGVNSDEQSPILATIVQGELKGAKLLGKFTRVEKKVVLSFATMSVPEVPRSVSVNAVAIDPDTARTALASDVDNHYMLRYGTLFASSFLTGLSEAIAESGSTVVDNTFGNAIITNPTTSSTEKALIALGNVGTQYATVLGKNFNTPPTVKVDAGTGLGILFMTDTNVPLTTTGVITKTPPATTCRGECEYFN